MTSWVRFRHQDQIGFGTLSGQNITVHHGDMFDSPKANGKTLALADVELLAPTTPSKIVALWNNFHALAAKLDKPEPPEP
ncbi:MAG TPA: 2-hydroxyhepta-2,4-diene-1,7-dioate isomerase, partial [Afipia sp.]|nr:2-hydroxyhepta-2,4-diene-1,7-dioate isomerase [Afipia sp.]